MHPGNPGGTSWHGAGQSFRFPSRIGSTPQGGVKGVQLEFLHYFSSLDWGGPWLYAAISIFAGYVILGVAGFGSALIIMPLLAWYWPLKFIVPLILLIDIPASLLHTGLNVKKVAWREMPGLVPTALIGAVAGVMLLQHVNGFLLMGGLGAYVLVTGWRALRRKGAPQGAGKGRRWVAGGIIGMVESMFGAAGPLVLAWLTRRIPDIHKLRATLPAAILIFASIALLGTFLAGGLSDSVLWRSFGALLPVALLGVAAGHRVARHAPGPLLRRGVNSLMVVSGVVLLHRAITLAIQA